MTRWWFTFVFSTAASQALATAPTAFSTGLTAARDGSEVILRQAYSSKVHRVKEPAQVRGIVVELATLLERPWSNETFIKHGACLSQVVIKRGDNVALHLYMYTERVYLASRSNPQ
jgi:hypothetical protein